MALLHILAYAGGLSAFLFVTLSLASGLLWLAELIEEHSKYAKYIGIRAIYVIITLHILLYFTDSLPILPIIFSILCHLMYLQNFSTSWPYISLTSIKFILSCLFVIIDHFIWFFHFAHLAQESKKFNRNPKYRYGQNRSLIKDQGSSPAFGDVAAFFAICVWFVPLFLFLSLSANDNALPSLNTLSSGPVSPSPNSVDLSSPGPGEAYGQVHGSSSPTHKQIRTKSSTSLVKSVLSPLLSLLPRVRRNTKQKNEEGLIAPRTPIRGSPLHSPVIMPQTSGYFPWGSSDEGNNNNNRSNSPTPPNLNLDSYNGIGLGGRSRTPPPPRRIQSENQISKGLSSNSSSGLGMNTGTGGSTSNINPRGIATRNGRPALDNEILNQTNEIVERPKRSSPLGPGTIAAKSQNLNSRVNEEGLTRRKAD